MTYHPRQNWNRGRRQVYTRRDFLQRATLLGVTSAALPGFLAACLRRESGETADLIIGTPASPVEQPLFDDNPAIESGLPPEAGPLLLYNWEDYINPEIIPLASDALGVEIQETTFLNEEVALAALASGEVQYDVWFPTSQRVPVAVAAQFVQPLNHDYLPNLAANVWPQLADPYYDRGSRYTAPYVLYSTGIGYRIDLMDAADLEGLANPWEIFWNPKYRGQMGVLDSFTDTIAMALFRNGVADPSQATEADLEAAGDALLEALEATDIRPSIDGSYSGIPEGRFAIHHAWSGDLVNSAYYWPDNNDLGTARYLWPAKSEGSTVNGPISNDTMAVLKGSEHPVLAHMFIDFMLDADNALTNFSWVGYQPPQNTLTPEYLISEGWAADYLEPALVVPGDFELDSVWVQGPLDAETETLWSDQWTRYSSGG
ncbi:MAG: spermidine/putrescine ABC transporter substrate-binding protein [Actinobacteria bacterium]|nr:spermidine/putrescine ABC transporter substrate-binding protein [Actinomycetota bacterium]MCI0678702.1 spermidine/putrescine ABC transporter substrate-binding protein [Actinomycetota bacterium]